MGFMLALVFIIMAATYYFDGTSGPIRDQQVNGGILAQQLILQQAAASRVCPDVETCPAGTVINAYSQLASYDEKTAKSNFGNGDLGSFSTGTKIVSYFKVAGTTGYQTQVYGSMGAWLVGNSPKANVRYVGRYLNGVMQSAGTVGYQIRNPDGSYTRHNCVLANVTLTGLPAAIPNGAPMLATDLYSSGGDGATNVSPCT